METSNVIAGVALAVSIFAMWLGWWSPKSMRIQTKLREAEPSLKISVGHYGGSAGDGINVSIGNRGPSDAYNLTYEILGTEAETIRETELFPGSGHVVQMPISSDDPSRTQRVSAKLRVTYHDRYECQYIAELDLIQARSAESDSVGHEVYILDKSSPYQQQRTVRPDFTLCFLWRMCKTV